jgi:phosphate transport system substrate-binding protein
MKRSSLLIGLATFVCLASPVLGFALEQKANELKGSVMIDGSSTVFPITEAVAEEFQLANKQVRVKVGMSGTGGGFKKFTIGETDINDASRPIKDSEIDQAKKNNISYIELPVAYDGITVVVNKTNTWVDKLTVAELKKIWEPESKVKTWADVRKGWPNVPMKLYGPGTDSGTFDYFTEAINGKSHVSRSDFTKSEDDNVLVQGVAGDKNALGYFGFAYFMENQDKLRAIPIDNGSGPVMPSMETINGGKYIPLSRKVYIYVSNMAIKRPEVVAFVNYYLDKVHLYSKEVGYVPLPVELTKDASERFKSFVKSSKTL